MTDKQIVRDFLDFLQEHKGYIVTNNNTYNYLELHTAIVNCLRQAMDDGYEQGKLDAEANALYDVTIGGHKDW